jgi:hypothetical protein
MEAKQSVFDLFLEIKKEKWKFEWLPMDPSFLKKAQIIHKDYLSEFNMETGQLDQGCYVLTKEFIIKLKSASDTLTTGKVLPLYFPRFNYIEENGVVYTHNAAQASHLALGEDRSVFTPKAHNTGESISRESLYSMALKKNTKLKGNWGRESMPK